MLITVWNFSQRENHFLNSACVRAAYSRSAIALATRDTVRDGTRRDSRVLRNVEASHDRRPGRGASATEAANAGSFTREVYVSRRSDSVAFFSRSSEPTCFIR